MKNPTYNKETREWELDGISFRGHHQEWRFEFIPETYLKESELSGDQWRKGGTVRIFLNDDCVCEDFCRTEDRAMIMLTKKLDDLKCFFEMPPVSIENWKEEIVGRKIYHAGVPSIVERYCGEGEIIVRTEDGSDYEIYGYKKEEKKNDPYFKDEWKDKDRVHITDMRIDWYRS